MYPTNTEQRGVIEAAKARVATANVSLTRAEETIRNARRMIVACKAHIAELCVTVAIAEGVIRRSRAFLAARNLDDPIKTGVILEPRPSYEEKLRAAHRVIAALREQGRHCELRHMVTLH